MSRALAAAARRLLRGRHALDVDAVALGFGDADRRAELAAKLQRVARLLDDHEADALWLRRPENLAWVSGGGDLMIHREGAPVADAGTTPSPDGSTNA